MKGNQEVFLRCLLCILLLFKYPGRSVKTIVTAFVLGRWTHVHGRVRSLAIQQLNQELCVLNVCVCLKILLSAIFVGKFSSINFIVFNDFICVCRFLVRVMVLWVLALTSTHNTHRHMTERLICFGLCILLLLFDEYYYYYCYCYDFSFRETP